MKNKNTNFNKKIQELESKIKIEDYEKLLEKKGASFWETEGQKKALTIFHLAAEYLPAYKDFLKTNNIKHESINTIEDFKKVPITNKKNYIEKYPLNMRCWKGEVSTSKIIATSSGTSGKPHYWPRGDFQEKESELIHEVLFRNYFNIQTQKTLLVIGFPMGVYVSGLATTIPSLKLTEKYSNLTIACPGNNKVEALKLVKNLSQEFEQTILIGHPFFVKDLVETGKQEGINWKKLKIKMMFCSEAINEDWRSYLTKQAEVPELSIFNTYGSSEMLLMGYESRDTISLKKIMETNEKTCQKISGKALAPSLFQYNPLHRYIESVNQELIFTVNSGTPLIRFNLHDSGTILKLNKITEQVKNFNPKWKLPVLAMWGRSDHTIIFYAANIYPQHINTALNKKEFLKYITGKFSMQKGELKNKDEYLNINIELKSNTRIQKKYIKIFQSTVVSTLRKMNSEYEFLWNNLNKNIVPKIIFWPYQHEKFFKQGLKPKYII